MPDDAGWAERTRTPGPAPQHEVAPTAPAAAPLSAANFLAIQRSAGNQAALALMRSLAPADPGVIRRVWEPHVLFDDWHEHVAGVSWHRKLEDDGTYLYWYECHDGADPTLAEEDSSDHTAEWFAAWDLAANPWFAGLTGAGGAAVVAPPEPALEPAEQVPAEQAPAEQAPAAPVIADAAAYHGVPTVASVRAPEYAPGGNFSWPVTMTTSVAALPNPSWIVQKVIMDIEGQVVTFYEAFPVPANQTVAADSDIYQNPEDGSAVGTSSIRGLMQHHVFDGNGYPPGFAQNAVEESDGEQWAMYAQPDFWVDGAGAQHDLAVTWNDGTGAITLTTVPATAAFTQVDSSADFT